MRKAYRYMDNRPDQFDYKFASEEDFPLGSGRVESAHGHVLQNRLKISGAWWDEPNAERIGHLRALRTNGRWEQFWAHLPGDQVA